VGARTLPDLGSGQFLAVSNQGLAGCVEQQLNKTEVLSHGEKSED
jgi:hypothetical protein